MHSLNQAVLIMHLFGMALGVGAATVKLVLLLKSSRNPQLFSSYFSMAEPVTKTLLAGMLLLVLSGIAWVLMDYPLTPLFIIKLVLVVAVIVTGSLIGRVFGPRLAQQVMAAEPSSTLAFAVSRNRLIAVEMFATMLMYAIALIGVLL